MKKKYLLQSINICLMVILGILLFLGVTNTQLLSKKLTIGLICSFVILTIVLIFLYLSKKNKLYNTGVFLTILINIVLAFEIYSLNNNYEYLNNIAKNTYEYKVYNVYVQKSNTTYSNLKKLNGKRIGLLKNNQENVKDYLNNLVDVKYIEYNNVDDICEGIKNGEIQAFIINEDKQDKLVDNKYINKIRVIYSNKIKKNI